MVGGHGGIVVGLRDDFAVVKGFFAFFLGLREFESGLGIGQVSLRLINDCLVSGRVQLGDDLAVCDGGIVIDEEFADDSGDLTADVNVGFRIQLAGGGDELNQIAAGDFRSLVVGRAFARMF